jgi:hypothetical protein
VEIISFEDDFGLKNGVFVNMQIAYDVNIEPPKSENT